MAWTTTLTEQLRYYLDQSDSTTYTDAVLSKFIAFAATEIFGKFGLNNTYTIDISTPTITPDPSSDLELSALLVLKAAAIIIRNEIKKYALTAGYAIRDDKVQMNGAEALKALKDLYKMYEDRALKAEFSYQMGNGTIGRAILAPYVPGNT